MNKRNLISLVMTILMPISLFGQEITEVAIETSIGGVVSDESNNPIVGANVIDSYSGKGVTSNTSGYYSISVNQGSVVLLCSFISSRKDVISKISNL